ncbi:MAG: aminofutalosine synthase MqnE [candidate division Zixibacteria bacterium]|nr:aminofutalosine synthase MqnE [candidate division Zixibacteria bacterium]
MNSSITDTKLLSILDKVMQDKRLSVEDGVALFESDDLAGVGCLADMARDQRVGDKVYWVRNLHINYTDICAKGCKFCAFARILPEDGYVYSHEQTAREIGDYPGHLAEAHIVGGCNGKIPWEYYPEMIRTIKRVSPETHVKAFTMVELDFFARKFKRTIQEVLDELLEAGLDACPGGGAEIFSTRLHSYMFRHKAGPERWLEVAEICHEQGVKTNATMLFGHIETFHERAVHLDKLRELQDKTGGFQAFIPLAYHADNNDLEVEHGPGAQDILKTVAVSRLMLDNFKHIKAYWILMGERLAQISLVFGANDIDGTVMQEKIYHRAGAPTAMAVTPSRLRRLIKSAGRIPMERDALYQSPAWADKDNRSERALIPEPVAV